MDNKRSFSLNSSASIIAGNEDLLTEILLFLPAKSLIRFKVVSKHWHSLISAPYFSRLHILHRRRPKSPHSLILGCSTFFVCHPTMNKLVRYTFPFPYVTILQSCNGLFLLKCKNYSHGSESCYVYNPTTKQYRKLFLKRAFMGLRLIFDPSKSHHYKVVCFKKDPSVTSFVVYDSVTHRWNEVDNFTWVTDNKKIWDGTYWKGGLYFIRSHYSSSSFRFFVEDGIHSVPQPPRIHSCRGRRKSYVLESNGHLHYIVLLMRPLKKNCLFVFEMKDDDSGWFTIFQVDLNPISDAFAADGGTAIELLGIIRGCKDEDSVLLFHVPGKIMIYRFGDEVFEVLVDFTRKKYYQEGQIQFSFSCAHQFIDSFATV